MNLKRYFRSAGRILLLLGKENPGLCFVLCLNTLLAGLMPTLDAYGPKRITEVCTESSPAFAQTVPWILLILLSAVLTEGAGLLNHKFSEISGQMLISHLREGMMDKMDRIGLSRFDSTAFKNLYQQAMGQINGNLISILINSLNALRGAVTLLYQKRGRF